MVIAILTTILKWSKSEKSGHAVNGPGQTTEIKDFHNLLKIFGQATVTSTYQIISRVSKMARGWTNCVLETVLRFGG